MILIRTMSAAIFLVTLMLLAGCGGGGGSSTSTNNPSPTTQSALVIDLASGRTRGLTGVSPADNTSSQIALIRVGDAFVSLGEVTAGQWQTVMGSTPWSTVPPSIAAAPSAAQPACNLSYADAAAFAAQVQERAGFTARLPTDGEWVSLVGAAYPWGADATVVRATGKANVRETNPSGGLQTMATVSPSPSGLYHLVGNIREWTRDGHLVGGSWADNLLLCSSTQLTDPVPSSTRHPLSGMRLVVER